MVDEVWQDYCYYIQCYGYGEDYDCFVLQVEDEQVDLGEEQGEEVEVDFYFFVEWQFLQGFFEVWGVGCVMFFEEVEMELLFGVVL